MANQNHVPPRFTTLVSCTRSTHAYSQRARVPVEHPHELPRLRDPDLLHILDHGRQVLTHKAVVDHRHGVHLSHLRRCRWIRDRRKEESGGVAEKLEDGLHETLKQERM